MPKPMLLFDWMNDHRRPLFDGAVRRYAKKHGAKLEVLRCVDSYRKLNLLYDLARSCSHIFMWGGYLPGQELIERVAGASGAKTYKFEVGWFPQADFFRIDPFITDLGGDSCLCHDLGWVNGNHLEAMQLFRDQWRKRFKIQSSSGVWDQHGRAIGPTKTLIPLQLPNDSAITLNTRYRIMQHLINRAEAEFPHDLLIVKAHPNRRRESIRPALTTTRVVRDGDIKELFNDVHRVAGATSTSLYEAAMAGLIVESFVETSALAVHAHEIDRLLAAMVALQFHRGTADITAWVNLADRIRDHVKG